MEIKHLVAAALIVLFTGAGVTLASLSQRARDVMFFLVVAGAVLTERMDVNFFSHEWYRGTTRGFEISLIDLLAVSVLAASLLVPRYRGPRWFWPAGLGLLVSYFLYACFSVALAEPRIFGLFELSKIVRGVVFLLAGAAFVRTPRELRWLVLGLVCAVGLQGLVGFKQHVFGGMSRVAGTLDHANSLSMYLCLTAPVLAAAIAADLPRWLRRLSLLGLAAAACTMMLTLSRAGIPVFALAVLGTAIWCGSWRMSTRKVGVGAMVLVMAGGLLYASWQPLMQRYRGATLTEEYFDADPGNEGRGVYLRWARMIVDDHVFGLGLNNWSYGVSKTYGEREGFAYGDYDEIHTRADELAAGDTNYAAPAHSLAALTLGELGVPGLLLFSALWLRWFQIGASFLRRRLSDPMHRLGVGICFGVGGVFLQSLTEWVFRHSPIFITFHLLVGVLAGLYHHQRSRPTTSATKVAKKPAARARAPVAMAAAEA